MIEKSCDVCEKKFFTYPCNLKIGKGKHCSRKCYELSKRGKPSWNTGKPAPWMIGNKHRLGKSNPNPHKMVGSDNLKWLGDSVGYRALHTWVERKLGKPNRCEFCGIVTKTRYHWANKSREYLRDVSDWIRLCPKCHKEYDSR